MALVELVALALEAKWLSGHSSCAGARGVCRMHTAQLTGRVSRFETQSQGRIVPRHRWIHGRSHNQVSTSLLLCAADNSGNLERGTAGRSTNHSARTVGTPPRNVQAKIQRRRLPLFFPYPHSFTPRSTHLDSQTVDTDNAERLLSGREAHPPHEPRGNRAAFICPPRSTLPTHSDRIYLTSTSNLSDGILGRTRRSSRPRSTRRRPTRRRPTRRREGPTHDTTDHPTHGCTKERV